MLAVGFLIIFLVSHYRHVQLGDYAVLDCECNRLSLDILVIFVAVLGNHCLRQRVNAVGKSLDNCVALVC